MVGRAGSGIGGNGLPPDEWRHWLAGFIAGEGCFTGTWHHEKRGRYFQPQFSLCQRADEEPVLKEIREVTGIGAIYRLGLENNEKWGPRIQYRISGREACFRLIAILDGIPLRAKKQRDFDIWAEVVRARYGSASLGDLRSLTERLMACKRYDGQVPDIVPDPQLCLPLVPQV